MESRTPLQEYGPVAQSRERRTVDAEVAGWKPVWSAKNKGCAAGLAAGGRVMRMLPAAVARPPLQDRIGGSNVTAKRPPRISSKYRRMADLYQYFARDWAHCLDFSQQALQEMHLYESTGSGNPAPGNGYAHGKKMLDLALTQWREDMYRTLWPQELYDDPDLPDWWLDKVLGAGHRQWAARYREVVG